MINGQGLNYNMPTNFGDGSSSSGTGAGGINWGAGAGDLMGAIGTLFGMNSQKNPAGAAQPYLGQIPGAVSQYLNPYMQAGQGAMGNLQNEYGQLMNNPGQFMNQIGKQFQQSPGYQFQVNQATNAANSAAAAGGMAGSPAEQVQLAGTVNGLANQDYYHWLNGAMGMFGTGLQGQQDLMHQGFGASEDMGNALSQSLSQQAAYGYAGQAAQNQSQGAGIGSIFGDLASWLGSSGAGAAAAGAV